MTSYQPLVKWVGGKGKLIGHLMPTFPIALDAYYEPFVGGGSVLLHVLGACETGALALAPDAPVVVNDVHAVLIETYRAVADPHRVDAFLTHAHALQAAHDTAEDPQAFYYAQREAYNAVRNARPVSLEQCARFVYLNKACFRGLWRESKNGAFNVPYGHYKSLTVATDGNVHALHRLFRKYNVRFECGDGVALLNAHAPTGAATLVFLDPPYEKLNATTFASYSAQSYVAEGLFEWIHGPGMACCTRMTNHATPALLQRFADLPLVHRFQARRAIHAKCPNAHAEEVLVGT